MLARFKVNLGIDDANRLGLDWQKCRAGAECEVTQEVAEKLGGVVEVVARPIEAVAKPAAIEAPKKAKHVR